MKKKTSPPPPSGEIALLLELVDQAFSKRAWHGPNVKGILRGVTAEEAAWRPGPGRHNVWELVLHVAYWKYAVRRRLTGEKRGSFAPGGSNWFARPAGAPDDAAWRKDLALLGAAHRDLRRVVAALDPRGLHRRSTGSVQTPARLVAGVAAHDLYHAGQMQIVKKLRESG